MIVFDRFHVIKSVNKELNLLRKIVGVTDKYSKYFRLKNQENLNIEEKEKLEQILRQSACLRVAYELKESLRNIYETGKSVKAGRARMIKWLSTCTVFLPRCYPNNLQPFRGNL